MSRARFTLPKFDTWEKDLELATDDLMLQVDFDDVDHNVVEELIKIIVPVLNDIPKAQWEAAVRRGRRKSLEDNPE